MIGVETEHEDGEVDNQENDVDAAGAGSAPKWRHQTLFQIVKVEETPSARFGDDQWVRSNTFFNEKSCDYSGKSESDWNTEVDVIIFITFVDFTTEGSSGNISGRKYSVL